MGLLKGIDPLLTADVLHVLRSMGHGDKLCICDCNFPAAQVAVQTTSQKHIILTVTLPEALEAICSVFPLDFFENKQAMYMGPQHGVQMPPAGLEVVSLMKDSIVKHCGNDVKIHQVERYSFYKEAKSCFAVIQCCLERRPYGNVILLKGCLGPDGLDLKPTSAATINQQQLQQQQAITQVATTQVATLPTGKPELYTGCPASYNRDGRDFKKHNDLKNGASYRCRNYRHGCTARFSMNRAGGIIDKNTKHNDPLCAVKNGLGPTGMSVDDAKKLSLSPSKDNDVKKKSAEDEAQDQSEVNLV